MTFEEDMRNALKAIKCILDAEGWELCSSGSSGVTCNTKNGQYVCFIRNINHMIVTFSGIESLYDELILSPLLYVDFKTKINPWYHLSNEEIFIKCDLERDT